MTKPTHCSIDGCTHRAHSRGMCNGHYSRWRKTGSTFRPCPTCGKDLPVTKGLKFCSLECAPRCIAAGCTRLADAGVDCSAHATRKSRTGSYYRLCAGCGNDIPIHSSAKRYCSAGCRKKCSIGGCERVAVARGLCGSHASRVRSNGSTDRSCQTCGKPLTVRLGQTVYCAKVCHPKCSADGCSREIYRASLCDAHFALSREDTPPWIGSLKLRDFDNGCKSCGSPSKRRGSDFCSHSCYCHFRRRGSAVRDHMRSCKSCGEQFSLLDGAGDKRRPLSTLLCLACKRRKNNYRKHIPTIILRDGGDCALCKERIDETLTFPHPMSLSLDHIVPWSAGGTDELENLQLAHLACNNQKQDRVGFTNA